MHSALEDIVRLGGLALQAEDCAIRAAVHHRGEHGGLARMEHERYHQFIIWRAILPIWHAEIERDKNTDIIISRDGIKHHFELKNWRGSTGNPQLPSIRNDVSRLQVRDNGYVLITSVNPMGDTNKNIEHLFDHVDGFVGEERQTFSFATVGRQNEALEYWLVGWPVRKLMTAYR